MAKIKITYIDDFIAYDPKLKKSSSSKTIPSVKAEELYEKIKELIKKECTKE